MASKRISLEWTKQVDPDKRVDVEGMIVSSQALKILKEILKGRLEEATVKELSPTSFENPTWAYVQAYENGRKYELRRLIDLLDFDK